jgi:hypothetical protein
MLAQQLIESSEIVRFNQVKPVQRKPQSNRDGGTITEPAIIDEARAALRAAFCFWTKREGPARQHRANSEERMTKT